MPSHSRSLVMVGLELAGLISVGTPRTKPTSSRPREMQVDHRHLLGDAHRLAAVGDRIAEDQDARVPGLAGQDRGRQRRAGIDAARRRMMLVEHDVEAELVGDAVLVEIAVVEVGADFGSNRLFGIVTRVFFNSSNGGMCG